jgi:hypothetical protein
MQKLCQLTSLVSGSGGMLINIKTTISVACSDQLAYVTYFVEVVIPELW